MFVIFSKLELLLIVRCLKNASHICKPNTGVLPSKSMNVFNSQFKSFNPSSKTFTRKKKATL